VIVPPLMALSAWGWWQMQLCGDPLGATKALFQAQLASVNADMVQRDLSPGLTSLVLDDLLRRLGLSWQDQLSNLYGYLGYGMVALFFFPALLHPFRRAETAGVRWTLAIVFISVLTGMGFVGLPEKLADDNALYLVVMPALSLFGAAMLVVMWSRLHSGHTFWAQWGGPAVALAITALPMLVNLPVYLKFGLTLGSRMQPHWPPFVPERAAVLKVLVEKDEYLLSDAPAFVAWYADVPCAALPVQREDFTAFQKAAAERKARLAGFVMTPVSAKCDRFSDVFTGPYAEWKKTSAPRRSFLSRSSTRSSPCRSAPKRASACRWSFTRTGTVSLRRWRRRRKRKNSPDQAFSGREFSSLTCVFRVQKS